MTGKATISQSLDFEHMICVSPIKCATKLSGRFYLHTLKNLRAKGKSDTYLMFYLMCYLMFLSCEAGEVNLR